MSANQRHRTTKREQHRHAALPHHASLPAAVARFVRRTIAPATQRGYDSDIRHFFRHGGRLPASDRMVALYLARHADVLKVATLQRRLAALQWAHRQRKLRSPIGSPLVRDTMKGIRRAKGTKQRQVSAIDKPLLNRMLAAAGKQRRMTALRDQALLLIGFAGAFRRGELVSLTLSDLSPGKSGFELLLRRGKTDQEGAGRTVVIPKARGKHCPVRALRRWLQAARIESGPIFRPVSATGTVRTTPLRAQSVAIVVKRLVAAAGGDEAHYAAHSLRAGYITLATTSGISNAAIRQQTGHRSDAMLIRYVRTGPLHPSSLL